MTEAPDAVKARILRAAAASRYPLQALPNIALEHEMTIDQVKAVVEKHGWPRPESMRRAAGILEDRARDAVLVDELRAENRDDDVLVHVPLAKLHPDPDNPRDDLGDLAELAGSLAEAGLVQPVIARRQGDHLTILAGHRRTAAARLLGWDTIACVIRATTMSLDEALIAMLAENGQREPLDPIDEARALARLKERDDITDVQIGKRISRSQAYVSNRLALLHLTPDEQAKVRAGTMALAAATTSGRKTGGFHRPSAQGKKSAAHLTSHHPLAQAVTDLCSGRGHSKHTPGRIGGIACGGCWEDAIRADERRVKGL